MKTPVKKIALIATGGTIEMASTRGRAGSEGLAGFAAESDIIKTLQSLPADLVQRTTVHRFCRLDSSDMGREQWQSLVSLITQHKAGYGGFVITHGTDTMAYTAAALAFALRPILNFPVILTGSMRTPDREDSDAACNIEDALRLAESDLAEVAIVMQGCAWRGTRAQKVTSLNTDAFVTPGLSCLASLEERDGAAGHAHTHVHARPHIYEHAGRIRDCRVSDSSSSPASHASPVGREMSSAQPRPPGSFNPSNLFSKNLCFFSAVPAAQPPAALSKDIKVVLLAASGGNLTPDFLEHIRHLSRTGIIPVIGSTIPDQGSIVYPPLARAMEMGAISAVKYSLPALLVKLSFLIAQSERAGYGDAARREFIARELAVAYAGEI